MRHAKHFARTFFVSFFLSLPPHPSPTAQRHRRRRRQFPPPWVLAISSLYSPLAVLCCSPFSSSRRVEIAWLLIDIAILTHAGHYSFIDRLSRHPSPCSPPRQNLREAIQNSSVRLSAQTRIFLASNLDDSILVLVALGAAPSAPTVQTQTRE